VLRKTLTAGHIPTVGKNTPRERDRKEKKKRERNREKRDRARGQCDDCV